MSWPAGHSINSVSGASPRLAFHLLPASAVAHVLPAEAHALVVIGVEREDALEHLLCLGELREPPEAQRVTVQATQERPVLDVTPGQKPVEAGGQ